MANKTWYSKNKKRVRKYNREYWINNKDFLHLNKKEYLAEYLQTPKGKYSSYKATAKKRGLVFDLTFEEFMEFWMKPCTYCGGDVHTIGLDRVDSQYGYILSNIAPACRLCNLMKSNLPLEMFIEHCKIISRRN